MTVPAPIPTNTAVIAIVRDKDGRVLVVARKEAPHEYALPGGSVDEGETPEQAIRRELREETGIVALDVYPCTAFDKATQTWPCVVLTSPENPIVKVHVYACWHWDGQPADIEGPLDATGQPKPGVTWLTPPELLAQASTFKSSVERLMELGCLWIQFNATDHVAADLAVSEVHVPSAAKPKSVSAADLPAKRRNAMRETEFAWPEQRKFPLPDAAHVRNAAARLAQEVKAGRISKPTAAKIHKRIVAAGKRFGVEVASDDKGLPVAPEAPLKSKRGPATSRGRLDVTIDHPQHGRLEIRHMRERAMTSTLTAKDWDAVDGRAEVAESGSVLLYAKRDIALTANDDNSPTWNQISTRGTFAGHGAGVFSLDDGVFADIIRNYREVDGGKVAFDFEHASEQDASSGTIPVTGCPAQGWILDLRAEPDGLHALVDWLEPARTYIRERKYQFVSPAIRFGARHPVTGKNIGARLTSCACTNQPFLRGLQPLAAKDRTQTHALTGKTPRMSAAKQLAHSPHEFMPKIKACLDMHELSTPHEVQEKCKALREMCMSANAHGMSGGVDTRAYVDRLRDEMGSPVGCTVEDIFDAVDAMIQAAIDQHVAALHPEASAVRADIDEGGGADMSARVAAKDQTMADSIALKDVTTKLTATEAKLAEVTLTMRDHEVTIGTLKAENARLKDESTKLAATLIDERVAEAFDTYKDAKKLDEGAKDMMRVYCMTNRDGFDKLYPRVPSSQRVLLRSIVTPGGTGARDLPITTDAGAHPTTAATVVEGVTLGDTPNDTAVQLKTKDPTMSMSDAIQKALRLHAKARG